MSERSTKQRLADDLVAAGAPADMVLRAQGGFYDDYESRIATPILSLVIDAHRSGLTQIALDAADGKYDATPEEAAAWVARARIQNPEIGEIIDLIERIVPKPQGKT